MVPHTHVPDLLFPMLCVRQPIYPIVHALTGPLGSLTFKGPFTMSGVSVIMVVVAMLFWSLF